VGFIFLITIITIILGGWSLLDIKEGMRKAVHEGSIYTHDIDTNYYEIKLEDYDIPQSSSIVAFAESCVTKGPADIEKLLILGTAGDYAAYYSKIDDPLPDETVPDSLPETTSTSTPTSTTTSTTTTPLVSTPEPTPEPSCGTLADSGTAEQYASCYIKSKDNLFRYGSILRSYGMKYFIGDVLDTHHLGSENDNSSITWEDAERAKMCTFHGTCTAGGGSVRFTDFIKAFYPKLTDEDKGFVNKSACEWAKNWGGSC